MIGLIFFAVGRLVERDRAVQRAVVGHGQRVEAEALGLGDQIVDPSEAVEEAELRVDVEMREIVRSERQRNLSRATEADDIAASRRAIDGLGGQSESSARDRSGTGPAVLCLPSLPRALGATASRLPACR